MSCLLLPPSEPSSCPSAGRAGAGRPGAASAGSGLRPPPRSQFRPPSRVLLQRPLSSVGLPAWGPGRLGQEASVPSRGKGDCRGRQLLNNLWVTHTVHGRRRSKCLFKGKPGVRQSWVWAVSWHSQVWLLRLGGPMGSVELNLHAREGGPAQDPTGELQEGVQGCGCQPGPWQRCARREPSPAVPTRGGGGSPQTSSRHS